MVAMKVSPRGPRSGATSALTWFIIAFLAISPVPLGSTPPLAWTIWCLLLGLVALAYCISQSVRSGSAPTMVPGGRIVGGLFVALCLCLVGQALPLGRILGQFQVAVADGSAVLFDTISVAPGDTWLMLLRMISFALLFFLVLQAARDRTSANRLLVAIVIIVTAHALYGLVALYQLGDTLLGAPKWKYFGVATGTFLNRNSFATYLAMGMAVTVTLAAQTLVRKQDERLRLSLDTSALLYLVAMAIIITTVVVTNSRAGFAVTMVGVAVVIAASVVRNSRVLRPLIIVTPVALVLFAGMFLSLGERIWLRFEDSAVAFDFRLELYRQVLQLIAQRPLLGFGGGTFEQAFPIVHAGSLPNQLTWDEAHSTYLELWADLGILAGSIPMVLVAALATLLVVRLAGGQGSWAGQTAALACIVAAGLHALVDFSLEIEAVAFLFATICAIGVASGRMRKSEE